MERDIAFNAIAEYDGTLERFNQKLLSKKRCCSTKSRRLISDLSSCPIDGAYLTLSKIGGLVVLFHSPPGCSTGLWILWGGAYSLKSVEGTKKESSCITLCTNMNEDDIVYGGTNKLRNAVLDIKNRFNPVHTVILSSCCSGIIGDDFSEVVDEAKEKYGMSLGWLNTSGFKSWYWPNGYDLAHEYIVNEIMEPQQINDLTINIIPYGNAASVDEKECARLLQEIGLNPQLPMSVPFTSISRIKSASKAKANTMMCLTYGWNFCRCMKQRFGTQYSEDSHPIGLHFTRKWLRSVAKMFNKEDAAEQVIYEEERKIAEDLANIKSELSGKTIAITAGHDKAPALLATALELGLKVGYIGLVTYDDLARDKINEVAAMFDYDIELHVFPQTYEEIPYIKKLQPDVFIGPAGLTPKNVMMQIPSVSTHFNDFIGPYFGFRGLINLGREILSAINDPMPHFAPFDFLISGNERVCGKAWYEGIDSGEGKR